MKPTLGRTVIAHGIDCNGSLDHPAIITRAWSDADTADGPVLVNLTILPDCALPMFRGSVQLFDTAEAARAERGDRLGVLVAYWPPRDQVCAAEGGAQPAVEIALGAGNSAAATASAT